jgi:hypothetical protein
MTVGFGAFWALFRERAAALSAAESADNPLYDELLAELQRAAPGLFLDFSTGAEGCELIVTADGDRELFPAARAAVSDAPTIAGWKIRALKPQSGFPETVTWDGVSLPLTQVVFDPLERPDSPDLGIRILVPDLQPAVHEAAHNAILRALDHGLGEEAFAEAVRFTELRSLPAGASLDDFIPLVELPAFVRWRAERKAG